jgi:hypothetical protein
VNVEALLIALILFSMLSSLSFGMTVWHQGWARQMSKN